MTNGSQDSIKIIGKEGMNKTEKAMRNNKAFIARKFSMSISQPYEFNKWKKTHLFIILGATKFN